MREREEGEKGKGIEMIMESKADRLKKPRKMPKQNKK